MDTGSVIIAASIIVWGNLADGGTAMFWGVYWKPALRRLR
jgi:hypothetical protein